MSAKEPLCGKFFAECRNGQWVVYLNDAGDAKYLCDTNTEGKAKEVVTAMNEYMAVFERNFAGIKSVDVGESILSHAAEVAALRAERDALRSRVDAADAERDEALKVADVATDAAAKAVLDAKEVYEVRHLETIRRLKALLKEVEPFIDPWRSDCPRGIIGRVQEASK